MPAESTLRMRERVNPNHRPGSGSPTPADAGQSSAAEGEAEAALPVRVVVGHVARYLKPVAWLLATASLLVLANRALFLCVPRIASNIIDEASGQAVDGSTDGLVVFLIVIFVVVAVSQFGSMTMFAYVGERVAQAMRRDAFAHLLSLSVAFFQRRRVGELLSRLATDAALIRELGTTVPMQAIKLSLTFVGSLTLAATTNLHLTLLMLAFLPALPVVTTLFGRVIRRRATQVQDSLASSNVVVAEALSGVETVKAFGREDHEAVRYESQLRGVFKSSIHLVFARAGMVSIATALFYGGLAMMLVYAAGMIEAGDLTTGELIAFLAYTMMFGMCLAGGTEFWAQWQRVVGAGQRVMQLQLEEPSVADQPRTVPFDGSHQVIRFEHVGFAYPSRPDLPVLHDLNLSAQRGEVVALVGESGAGKSTVVSLLLRHHDVTAGAIKIDGHDIRELRQRDLRQAIAVVPQDVIVFGRTLRENIAYGNLDATESEVIAAARAAHALEFIERTPDGLDTFAGERGLTLSGGERQRIAIARALLKNPQILVLDEATSALDSESERLVKEAFETLMAGRTTFVIAHRLSTIERADRVVVLHQGRVVETGTHAELVAADGRYARLYRSAERNEQATPEAGTQGESR